MATPDAVGQVYIPLAIQNHFDQHLANQGMLHVDSVRAIEVPDALADTGTTELGLPAWAIERLGLDPVEAIGILTAVGYVRGMLYTGALVTVEGRSRAVNCLELPDDAPALLGAIAMETLGIELDLQNRSYRLLPSEGPHTFIRA